MRAGGYAVDMVGDGDRAQPRMTFAEAATLDPDTHPGEVDGGRWVSVTRNTWQHGELVSNLAFLFTIYVRTNPGWSVSVGDPGTKLGPDTLRGPDLGMVRSTRRPLGTGAEGWLDGAPELVVEVKGDSQTFEAMTRKVFEYLKAGAQQVWVVNPGTESVVVYAPTAPTRLFSAGDVIDGGESFPGLVVPLAELFRR
jgi:Uma2 family endonuclease